MIPMISLSDGEPFDVHDLQLAINTILSRMGRADRPRLEGLNALKIDVVPGGVCIRCLNVRSQSGYRLSFENVTLPVVEDEMIEVVIDWELRPIRRGASIQCREPVLRSSRSTTIAADGILALGILREGKVHPILVCAEFLGSCEGWIEWSTRVRQHLQEVDEALLLTSARLERDQSHLVTWGLLLQPIATAASELDLALDQTGGVAEALKRSIDLGKSVMRLASRASLCKDPDIERFLNLISADAFDHQSQPDAQDADAVLQFVARASRLLRRLANSIRLGENEFVDPLYVNRALYRLHGSATVTPVPGGREYIVDCAVVRTKGILVVRWSADDAPNVGFGDVIYHAEPRLKGEDRHLPGIPSGERQQIISEVNSRGRLVTRSSLSPPEIMLYVPS